MKIGLIPLIDTDGVKMAPIGIQYVASYLEKYSKYKDEIFVELTSKELLKKNPDIIGISSVTQFFERALKIAKKIKEHNPQIIVIVGGIHISFMPNTLSEYMDIGVMGEGEQTMLELMNLIHEGQFYNFEKRKKINGLVFRDENKNLYLTEKRGWIDRLDDIPPPKRELYDGKGLYQSIMTSRGCTFKCGYCSSSKYWQNIRFHSPERIVEEIEYIIEHYPNEKSLSIIDDLFSTNKPRLKKLVDLIISKNIHKKIGFICNARASVFDEETCELLVKMNASYIMFGFESLSDKILKYLKGSSAKVEDTIKALEISKKYGLKIHGNFIIGSPLETKEDLLKTYWFMRENRKMFIHLDLFSAVPYPNTLLWDRAVEAGIIDKDFSNWSNCTLDGTAENYVFINEMNSKKDFVFMLNELKKIPMYGFFTDIHKRYVYYHGKIKYSNIVYERCLDVINKNFDIKNILEISTFGKNIEINSTVELRREIEKTKVNIKSGKVDIKDIIKNSEKTFDTVLLTHSMEYIKDIDKLFDDIKDIKRVIILCDNVKHILMMANLLLGDFVSHLVGVDKESIFNHYSLSTLKKYLNKKDYKVIEIEKNIGDITQYQELYKNILIFKDLIDVRNYIVESNIASFIVVAEKNTLD